MYYRPPDSKMGAPPSPATSHATTIKLVTGPIDNAKAVIVLVSTSYMKRCDSSRSAPGHTRSASSSTFTKDHCQLSFHYACQRLYPDGIITIVTEAVMR